MFCNRLGITAMLFIGVGATGTGLVVGQSPGVVRRSTPTVPGPGAPRLSSQATLIYNYVKKQLPGEVNWRQIPWLTNLPEAIRQAKAENRPLLLWLSDDEPLDRC